MVEEEVYRLRKGTFLGRRPAWENELRLGERLLGPWVKRTWLWGGVWLGKNSQLGACVCEGVPAGKHHMVGEETLLVLES